MDWYAIQVTTGRENVIISALKDNGSEILYPQVPVFFKHSGQIDLIHKPLMPGYVIAKLDVTNFYLLKRDERTEKMLIRICGTGYETVSLSAEDLDFICQFCKRMQPVYLNRQPNGSLKILSSPFLAKEISVKWYDGDKFKAKLMIKTNGNIRNHMFVIGAFVDQYNGRYRNQLKGLFEDGSGTFGAAYDQVNIL